MSSAIKRLRSADDPSTASAAHHQLSQFLHFGVLQFLPARDILAVVNCCKALRDDSELATAAFQAGPTSEYASHFFHNCGLDWFSFSPERDGVRDVDTADKCEHETSEHSSTLKRVLERPQASTQLLSLIGIFEKLILSAHLGNFSQEWGYNYFAVPVAISLWEHHPDKKSLRVGHEWTREDVRVSLNAVRDGLGDQFTDEDPKNAFPSDFGAHWESIEVDEDGSAACTLCAKASYIRKRYHAVMKKSRTGDASDLDTLSATPAGQKFAFCNKIIDELSLAGSPDCYYWIAASGQVGPVPFSDELGWNHFDSAIDGIYDTPTLCREYAQPLKQSLHSKAFKFANRIKYPNKSNRIPPHSIAFQPEMLARCGWRRLAAASTPPALTRSAATAAPNGTTATAAGSQRKCVAYRLGCVEYETAWDWQKQLIQRRIAAARELAPIKQDVVLVLEHPSVYTLGRGATMDNVKFDPQVDTHLKLLRVDRGGEVTYHGPGQVVVYPILDLNSHKKDLHWYLRQVEEVVIQTLAAFDIKGERVDGLTGVWVEEEEGRGEGATAAASGERDMRKIAAVGTHATRWITMHGFAINTTTDLRAFDRIVPCGIDDRAVTSIARLKPSVTPADVELAAIEAIREVFGVDVTTVEAASPL